MNRFTHWLGWKVWNLALKFPHIKAFQDHAIVASRAVGERTGTLKVLTTMADAVDLQWPAAPTLALYKALKVLWINDPIAIRFPFPICIVEDDELTGKLVYDPNFDKEASRWMLTAAWIEENKAEKQNV